jgi:hypothetical protein
MQNFVALPTEESGAQKALQDLLDQPDQLLLLILGDDDVADEATDTANFIRSRIGKNGISMYEMVVFVKVTAPMTILPLLKKLKSHERVNLADYNDFVLLSISPFRNVISEGVTRARFMKGRGSMNTAVMTAYANG